MKNKIKQKKIIITGGSSGIGYNLVRHFSKKNYTVIPISKTKTKINEYKNISNEIDPIFFDLTNFTKYPQLFDKINKLYGPIDHLIHSAGIHKINSIKAFSLDDILNSINLNLVSAILMSKYISNNKYFKRPGSHVFVSSVMGVIGEKGQSVYSASKSGLYGLAKSLSIELAKNKIRVNVISPGSIDSPLYEKYLNKITSSTKIEFSNKHPLGIGNFNDINNLVEFLISNKSKWITGQNLIIDGGYSIN